MDRQVPHFREELEALQSRLLEMGGLAEERVRAALVGLWQSPLHSQSGKAQVAIALCKLGLATQDLIGTVAKALVGDQDASNRKSAAEALTWCNKTAIDVVPALASSAQ